MSGIQLMNAQTCPFEILASIFHHLRPKPCPQPDDFDYNSLLYHANHSAYHREKKALADIRLVCSKWDAAIKPLVYEQVVLAFQHPTLISANSIRTVFEAGAAFIKTVVIISRPKPLALAEAEEALAAGLKLCKKVESLRCDAAPMVFKSRYWIWKAPGLQYSLRSLSIESRDGLVLSHALLSVDSLEKLEIRSWLDGGKKFALPRALPHLSDISIIGSSPPCKDLLRLFARIKDAEPSSISDNIPQSSTSSSFTSPLRSLKLEDVDTINTEDMLEILNTNGIRFGLTSLELFCMYQMDFHLPVRILQLCPNLTSLTWNGPVDVEIMKYLKPTLEHLSLGVFCERLNDRSVEEDKPCASRYARWIKSGGAQHLRSLKFCDACPETEEKKSSTKELRRLCDERGITLVVLFYPGIYPSP